MNRYQHPNIRRASGEIHSSDVLVINIETGELVDQGDPVGPAFESMSIEQFLERARNSREFKRRNNIPDFIYHSYAFDAYDYNPYHIKLFIEWARNHNMEVRTWVNPQSALMLIVVADPDTSENSGWDLNQWINDIGMYYRAYGLPSFYEFCAFGVQVPDDWQLIERQDKSGRNFLFACSDDGNLVLSFGR